ncbi:MAG TPA: sugar phosphate isomerase/epimerase [Candidatus Dormibacteraeota bacterium]
MDVDLLASCWTTAGNARPMRGDERSPFPLASRIATASRVGYRGFGIVHADLAADDGGDRLDEIAHLLAENGMLHLELEMLNDWFATGARRAASDAVRRDLLGAAERLQPRQIKIGGEIGGHEWPWGQLVETFADLCRQAADVGTRIAFEPMPFGQINNLVLGRRLIDDAGESNGGLILDLWHMARGGIAHASIRDLSARYVFAVEIDDADEQVRGASLLDDTLDFRRLCGEGDQDVAGFIAAVRATGYGGPWGVEILAEDFRHLSLEEQAERSYETSMRAFAGV